MDSTATETCTILKMVPADWLERRELWEISTAHEKFLTASSLLNPIRACQLLREVATQPMIEPSYQKHLTYPAALVLTAQHELPQFLNSRLEVRFARMDYHSSDTNTVFISEPLFQDSQDLLEVLRLCNTHL